MKCQRSNLVAGVAALLLACCSGGGSDTATEDLVTADADVAMDKDATHDTGFDNQVAPDSLGDAPDVQPETGVTAAQVTSEDQLLPGPYAMGRIGDYVLSNDYLTAIIGEAGHAKWGPFGGGILDLALMGGEDYFQELFPIAGFLRAVRVDSIEVVEDGSGGKAVVRVTGSDGPIPIIAAVISTGALGLDVQIDYWLEPSDKCLHVSTTVTNSTAAMLTVPLGDGLVLTESGRVFASDAGFNEAGIIGLSDMAYFGSELPDLTYLLVPPADATMAIALKEKELSPVLYGFIDVAAGESVAVERCFYVAKGRSANALAMEMADRGVATSEVTGEVIMELAGYDLTSMALDLTRNGQFMGAAAVEPTGQIQVRLPPGSYEGILHGPSVAGVDVSFVVKAGEDTALGQLVLVSPGRLDVSITNAGGAPVPSRISLQTGADAPLSQSFAAVVPDLEGKATVFLHPGDYTVNGSRGPFWSICRKNVTVQAGEVAKVSCAIEEEVDVAGWVAADLHTHSEYGVDSTLDRHIRVKAIVAEGLDFFAPTDHDIFFDFTPIVEDMDAGHLVRSIKGNEVSLLYAHFNCLGCEGEELAYFVFSWLNLDEFGEVLGLMTGPQVWKLMKDVYSAAMVQINHPRDGTGFFDFIGYDNQVGPASVEPGLLDDTFDAFEVWNANESWDTMSGVLLPDWYSFVNRGWNKIPTGNSDSHSLTAWVGQPRNMVQSDSVDEDDLFAALKAHKSVVTSAPLIEFTLDGQGLGETVVPAGADKAVEATIEVFLASWAGLTDVYLVANGETVVQWKVEESTDVLRFAVSETLLPQQDTWYHVIAHDSSGDLSPVYPGRRCTGFTQPIWVDLAGDGFDPPLD